MRRCLALLALAAGLAVPAAAHAADRPTYFVHGINSTPLTPYHCNTIWDPTIAALQAAGWTGTPITVGYYGSDEDCDVSSGAAGRLTSITEIAKGFANLVYGANGSAPVDAVTHSMGGLIVRRALLGVQRHEEDFPPALNIEDVVTWSAPHGGAESSDGCASRSNRQCQDMLPTSAFIADLSTAGLHPVGTGATDWTTIGSEGDSAVTVASATAMSADHEIVYTGSTAPGHIAELSSSGATSTYPIRRSDAGGPWTTIAAAPHWMPFTAGALTSAAD